MTEPEQPEPKRQRRRPAVACSLCRKRKIRCDREIPCSNCVRSKNSTCVYATDPSDYPRWRQAQRPQELSCNDAESSPSRESTLASHPPSSLVSRPTSVSTPASQTSVQDVRTLKSRIQQLEEQLAKATQKPTQSSTLTSDFETETTSNRVCGPLHFHRENRLAGHPSAISQSVTHKTRLHGQSHWFNGFALLHDVFETVAPHLREKHSKVFSGVQRCKSLAKVIKSRRTPQWPLPPTVDLPPKDVADELVNCYLRTSETIYRILHIPTFRNDYESLWLSDTQPDTAYLVQLKLVLAIGAIAHDDRTSLRASAIRWVYEAQTWISQPNFKSRLGIQYIQTHILLVLAQEAVDVGGDLVWVSAGTLLRMAFYMGLHRASTSLPKSTTFVAEMRRRLWNTILEVALQTSLTSGGPPLISLNDFDTEAPGNFDDDQLLAEDPAPRPEDDYTQVSIVRVLRKTFPIRLAVIKYLNDLASYGTYEEALRLDKELRASYKVLCRTIQGFSSRDRTSPSQFETRAIDLVMHRYIASLHIPFFGPALHETTYAFSRTTAVETLLKMWCALYPSSSIMTARSHGDLVTSDQDDLVRLTFCGSKFFRTAAMQALILIAAEIQMQLREEEGLGPVPLRSDLLSVLDEGKDWCLRCMKAGETNIKGYLLVCVLTAQVDGLMRNIGKDELSKVLVKAAEDAAETCVSMFEQMTALGQTEEDVGALHQISPGNPEELNDWDFMMSDFLLNPGNMGSMSWMFNDATMQGLPL